MSAPSQLSLRVVVLLIAASAPLALGIEVALRELVLVPMIGAELRELREFFWPALTDELRRATLTQTAWALVGATMLAGGLGVALLRRAARRERERDELRDQLLLLTSIPQVPAVLAILCFAFGSSLPPVLLSMSISTGFVLAQGWVGERLLQGRT
ncbi:MAG: hypothetical protein R6X02_15940 [Enhygromyxa sp.]